MLTGIPAAFRYFTSPPENWSMPAKTRVETHLKKLHLQELFSHNAGSRLSAIRFRLNKLHKKGGIDSVRAHLNEELESIEADFKNSWAAAMYRAAIDSDWFCDGGFSET
ncbi:MAG: hypothetical protein KKD44_06245 [Proteobacteria bacterium]|nr:hypothetical protein [Pseudomonadota bacterium]